MARSTLHDWQKRGQVVALLAGARKHAFPLEQFVDGRPMEGIADVLEVVGNPRRAWSWMVERSPLLAGKRPIDLLKQDRRDEVVEAAGQSSNIRDFRRRDIARTGRCHSRERLSAHPGSAPPRDADRSEEHKSELQSLIRKSYADFCLKKKT